MMVQIRFTDGTTEERDAASPARRMVDTKHGLQLDDVALRDCRGADDIEVKRGDAWAPCRIETCGEQIERLTAERDAAIGQVNALHKVTTSSDVDRAVEHAVTKVRAANAERERDAARRMVVLRSGGIKSSKEARELDALTNQAIEEGWFKVP